MKVEKYIDGLYGVQTNLDMKVLRNTCNQMYEIIKHSFVSDKSDYIGKSTLTTKLYTKYNLLLYPLPGLHDLYFTISEVFHSCLTDYHKGKSGRKYIMQCWLNYYMKGEYINWHSHATSVYGNWHGFLCVDTEPDSYTSYTWLNDKSRKGLVIDVKSKDGLMVMGITNNDRHRSSKWQRKDRPRITIAFDINPIEYITETELQRYSGNKYLNAMQDNPYFVNHWIPI